MLVVNFLFFSVLFVHFFFVCVCVCVYFEYDNIININIIQRRAWRQSGTSCDSSFIVSSAWSQAKRYTI